MPRRRPGGEGYDRGVDVRGRDRVRGGRRGRTRVGRIRSILGEKRGPSGDGAAVYLRLVHREIRMLRLRTIYAVEYSNQCRADIRLYAARMRTKRGKRGPSVRSGCAVSRTKRNECTRRRELVTSRDKIYLKFKKRRQ